MKEALKFLNKPLTIRWYLLTSPFTTTALPYVISPWPQALKEEIRNRIKEKSLTSGGLEPTTSGLDDRRSTN